GPRTSVDLTAPGISILTTDLGGIPYVRTVGTSVAAPHVTGAAALLLEYAANRRAAGTPDFNFSDDHLVLKAVLMNSADKLKDNGSGLRLGMEKTILKTDGTSTWLDSDARDSDDNPGGKSKPLDLEMGAGQLNARRALQQYRPGKFDYDANIPAVGWNWSITSTARVDKYVFAPRLKGSSYVSITLTWDRRVTYEDRNSDGKFDPGEF